MYQTEAQALDAEIIAAIERWHRSGDGIVDAAFDDLALRIFEHQLQYNEPYRRYCERLGETSPRSWEKIPAVPAAAFKETALTTFDPKYAALSFETSGTTGGAPGRHYMERSATYDAALLAGFDRFVLSDGARLRYFNLVPNPAEQPQSSLGYMMARISALRGDGRTGWYIRRGEFLAGELIADLHLALCEDRPVCIAATAFALVHLLDTMDANDDTLVLPRGSRVIETGGFKGRARVVDRNELYSRIGDRFGLARNAIVSEYGMTELTSQYYATGDQYSNPPWLRTRVVGAERATLPSETTGALLHVDLANRSSCIAVQTQDLGMTTSGGLILAGRDREAALRGCSLDAERLLSR